MNDIHPFIIQSISPYREQCLEEAFPGMGLVFDSLEGNKLSFHTFKNSKNPYVYDNLFEMGFCPLNNLRGFFYLGLYCEADIFYVKKDNKFYFMQMQNWEYNDSYIRESFNRQYLRAGWEEEADKRYEYLIDIPKKILSEMLQQPVEIDYYFNVILSWGI